MYAHIFNTSPSPSWMQHRLGLVGVLLGTPHRLLRHRNLPWQPEPSCSSPRWQVHRCHTEIFAYSKQARTNASTSRIASSCKCATTTAAATATFTKASRTRTSSTQARPTQPTPHSQVTHAIWARASLDMGRVAHSAERGVHMVPVSWRGAGTPHHPKCCAPPTAIRSWHISLGCETGCSEGENVQPPDTRVPGAAAGNHPVGPAGGRRQKWRNQEGCAGRGHDGGQAAIRVFAIIKLLHQSPTDSSSWWGRH